MNFDILSEILIHLSSLDMISLAQTSKINNYVVAKSLTNDIFFKKRFTLLYTKEYKSLVPNTKIKDNINNNIDDNVNSSIDSSDDIDSSDNINDINGSNDIDVEDNINIDDNIKDLNMSLICRVFDISNTTDKICNYNNIVFGLYRKEHSNDIIRLLRFFQKSSKLTGMSATLNMNYTKTIFLTNPEFLADFLTYYCAIGKTICINLVKWSKENLKSLVRLFNQFKRNKVYYHLCSISVTMICYYETLESDAIDVAEYLLSILIETRMFIGLHPDDIFDTSRSLIQNHPLKKTFDKIFYYDITSEEYDEVFSEVCVDNFYYTHFDHNNELNNKISRERQRVESILKKDLPIEDDWFYSRIDIDEYINDEEPIDEIIFQLILECNRFSSCEEFLLVKSLSLEDLHQLVLESISHLKLGFLQRLFLEDNIKYITISERDMISGLIRSTENINLVTMSVDSYKFELLLRLLTENCPLKINVSIEDILLKVIRQLNYQRGADKAWIKVFLSYISPKCKKELLNTPNINKTVIKLLENDQHLNSD